MSEKKSSPAMDFLVEQLRRNPALSYAELKESAGRRELTVYPIMYGRAKALLGLVKVAPRGSKKKAAAEREAKKQQALSEPAMPKRAASAKSYTRASGSTSLDGFESMLSNLKEVAEDRDRFHAALQEIGRILDEALDD